MDFFDRRRLGDLLSRLTSDLSAIEGVVVSGITRAVSLGLRIVLYGAALFYLQWQLASLALVVAPLFWAMSRVFARHLKEASRENRRTLGALTAVAEESLANVALVQAYNRREVEVERFRERSVAVIQSQLRAARLRGLYTPIGDLFELIGLLVVIGLGTWQLTRNQLTMGELLVFMAYFGQLASPLRGVGRLSNSLASASASAERIIELIDAQPTVAKSNPESVAARAWGRIVLDNVTFRYPGHERDVLHDISATIEPGQILAVVGESGAGKSSVAKLLLRFYDTSSGAIRLDGRDLRDWSLSSLRENVAVVLQETLVFDGTIRDNIMWARPEATSAEFDRAARAADLISVVSKFPDGYDTRVGQRGRRLSGGQRQRVAIARAMLRDSPVLLLDEPTTGLDAETTTRVMAPLRRLMRGRTTIIITHNLSSVRDADLILVLEGGRAVERGTHAQLLALGGAYARLYPAGQARTVQAPRPERWWASGHWWDSSGPTDDRIDASSSDSGASVYRGSPSWPSSLFLPRESPGGALHQLHSRGGGERALDPESGRWWS
jgi:ABC-type multidrug transport system fused ATPase/permease subunit